MKLPFEQEQDEARKKSQDAVAAHASNYTIFIHDERAKQLLAMWKEAARRRVPDNATLQEFVAASVRREWVQTIEDMIELAQRPADFLTT